MNVEQRKALVAASVTFFLIVYAVLYFSAATAGLSVIVLLGLVLLITLIVAPLIRLHLLKRGKR